MRETVRAIIINNRQQAFLVKHNERNPVDMGKWATVGGGLDQSDKGHESCLLREIGEEFGEHSVFSFKIVTKLFESVRPDRIDHFYLAIFSGHRLEPEARDEILDSGWFSLNEVKHMKLFFGFEHELIESALDLHSGGST